MPLRAGALLALALCALLCLVAAEAQAHALLSSSSPAANATLAKAPQQILLNFTEPPDPKLSLVEVVDSSGRVVPGVSPVQAVPGKPQQLRVALSRELPTGVYTVNWRSVSATDGHVADGAFAFGVGAAPTAGSTVVVNLFHTSPLASVFMVAGRWMLYAGLALLIGFATTVGLVLQMRVPRGSIALQRLALVLAAVGLGVMIGAERVLVGAPSLLPLFETAEGHLLLALGIALAVCLTMVVLCEIWPRRSMLALVGLAAATAVFVHVLAGHAAAPALLRPLNIAEQWVHMTAIGVWVGGLAWLLLGLRHSDDPAKARAVRAFSLVATVTLIVVVTTGVLRAITEVGAPRNLFDTSYGIALLAKVALFLALLSLGAFNHFRLVPAAEASETAIPRVRQVVRFEVVVAAAVLVATGVLSGLVPARYAALAGGPGAHYVVTSGSDFGRTVRVKLTVSPGGVGQNEYVVQVQDYAGGGTKAGVVGVQLVFTLPSQPTVGSSTLVLKAGPGGSWHGSGLQLSIAGTWNVGVLVQEPANAVSVPLSLTVGK